jgi:HK97 family phage prohead protease
MARSAPSGVEVRDYTQAEIDALGAEGKAFKNDDGTYAYPIADVEDLKNAIRAVGRGGSDHDAIRRYVMKRARQLEESDLIPDNWQSDGSLKEENARGGVALEVRETAMDVFAALDGAVEDACDGEFYWCWVQDWYGSGTDADPYVVVYCAGADLWSSAFEWDHDDKVVLLGEPVKVRPVTTYVARKRRSVSTEVRAVRDEMRGVREQRRMVSTLELREVPNGTGGTELVCSGYASTTCADRDDRSNSYEMEDMIGPWTESIVRGAFAKTIRENADVAFLPNHGAGGGLTMARTKAGSLKLSEDLTGLHYEARLNPDRPDVQILRAAIEDGAITESSFAFRVTRQTWSEDYAERWITEVSLDKGDVSPVNYGANPHTGDHPLSMRSAMAVLSARGLTWSAFEQVLAEIRSGNRVSDGNLELLDMIAAGLGGDPEGVRRVLRAVPDPEPEPPEACVASRLVVLPDFTSRARVEIERLRRSA